MTGVLRHAIGILIAVALTTRAPAKDTVIFRTGETPLPVLVAADATAEEKHAAAELARVLGRMSGLDWPVRADQAEAAGFYIGRAAGAWDACAQASSGDPLAPGAIPPDAFRIRTAGRKILIAGATPRATRHAVAWLLQEHGGVRWYAPGDAGEVIPRRTEWSLPPLDLTVTPAYLSRELHGREIADGTAWAMRNGLQARFEYTHALTTVFPPGIMATHADWQPVVRGRRLAPENGDDYHWQPNLTLPAVARHAAQTAIEAFGQQPDRVSFSLGINDTLRFDQGNETAAAVAPLKYFRGMPDYSPLVFGFMNRAAGELARVRGDRYLGGLAYFWCENVPPFPVHPQVLPYVTADRSQYYDPGYRAEDFALMARWQNSGARAFGLWEYAYGGGFIVPRLAIAAQAEAIREGWKRGARGYFAEIDPHPGYDAGKAWLLARLLWNPERSLEELTDDFFNGYYGAAALPMRRFFAGCEARWMQQAGSPYWLKYYRQEDQALLFPEAVCRELRSELNEAARLAANPAERRRVELAERAFAVTEAYVHFDALRRALAAGEAPEEETVLAGQLRALAGAEEQFLRRLQEAGEGEPAMAPTDSAPYLVNDPVPRLLAAAGRRDREAPRRILQMAGDAVVAKTAWSALATLVAAGQLAAAPDILTNGSFRAVSPEAPSPRFLYPRFGALPAGWEWRAVATEHGMIRLLDEPDGKTDRTLRLEGAWDAQIYQWVRAKPGAIYAAAAVLQGLISPGGDASLYLTFLSGEGKVTGTHRLQSLPKGQTNHWCEMILVDRAPRDAAWVGIGCGASRQAPGDWLEARMLTLREANETLP